MKIIKPNLVAREQVSSRLFTGGEVTRQSLVSSEMRRSLNMAIVNFGKGARNKFHTHTSDQVLIVTAGNGIVATEQEERTVSPGDIIFFPAGEKHWHGATKDSAFSHIYVVSSNSETKQLED
ncbi:MAG: cupin domain-containing protein [Chloroflexi bacterium]|nr:cupin domain-containing protein [Chloroflexota bacterium]